MDAVTFFPTHLSSALRGNGLCRKSLQTLDYFHSFPEQGKSCKTGRAEGKSREEQACGILQQFPPPVGDTGSESGLERTLKII